MRVKKIIKQTLYQVYQKYSYGPADVYAVDAMRGVELAEYEKLLAEMLEKKLLEPTMEPDYYRITHVGEMVGNGDHCTCNQCRPQDYR